MGRSGSTSRSRRRRVGASHSRRGRTRCGYPEMTQCSACVGARVGLVLSASQMVPRARPPPLPGRQCRTARTAPPRAHHLGPRRARRPGPDPSIPGPDFNAPVPVRLLTLAAEVYIGQQSSIVFVSFPPSSPSLTPRSPSSPPLRRCTGLPGDLAQRPAGGVGDGDSAQHRLLQLLRNLRHQGGLLTLIRMRGREGQGAGRTSVALGPSPRGGASVGARSWGPRPRHGAVLLRPSVTAAVLPPCSQTSILSMLANGSRTLVTPITPGSALCITLPPAEPRNAPGPLNPRTRPPHPPTHTPTHPHRP